MTRWREKKEKRRMKGTKWGREGGWEREQRVCRVNKVWRKGGLMLEIN